MLTSWVLAGEASSASGTSPPNQPTNGPTADWWPSLCLELGSLLQVNPDILRRHLVCELYNQGLDLQAEEVSSEYCYSTGKYLSLLTEAEMVLQIKPVGLYISSALQ